MNASLYLSHTLSTSSYSIYLLLCRVLVSHRRRRRPKIHVKPKTKVELDALLCLSQTHSLANTKHYQTRQMLMLLLRALTHSSNTSFTCVCVYHACVLCIVRGRDRERGKDGMVWGGVYLLGVNPTTRHVNAEMAILPSPFFFNPTPDIIFSLFCILHLYFVRL